MLSAAADSVGSRQQLETIVLVVTIGALYDEILRPIGFCSKVKSE